MKILNTLTILMMLALGTSAFALEPAEQAKVIETARQQIKAHLKAPATAVFSDETVCARLGKPDADDIYGTGPTPECKVPEKVGERKEQVIYRANVDAQNSFGALIRTHFIVYVEVSADGKWSALDTSELLHSLYDGCLALNEAARSGATVKVENCKAKYPNAAK